MPRPPASSDASPLDRALDAFSPALPLAVALSGGADSTALLIACAARWPQQVAAIHVHHGLQDAADNFALHCEGLCRSLGLPLVVCRVDARAGSGESPEEAARNARYAALAQAIGSDIGALRCRSLALAQHADDQVETLLLALSRGAGLPGLAAMPAHWESGGIAYHRPLLGVPGSAIRDWLAERREAFVEDPSNADQRLTRNRIRAQLLPALERCFPQFRETFARSTRHAAQAQGLLDDLAREDLDGVAAADAVLRIAALRALSRARQGNVLRHWLKTAHGTAPSATQLEELLDQLECCTTRGHRIRLKVGRGFVRRLGEHLAWYNAGAEPP